MSCNSTSVARTVKVYVVGPDTTALVPEIVPLEFKTAPGGSTPLNKLSVTALLLVALSDPLTARVSVAVATVPAAVDQRGTPL